MHPAVEWLQKKKIPRLLSIILVELLIIALIVVFLLILVPILINEINNLISHIPTIVQWVEGKIDFIKNLFEKNKFISDLGIDTDNFMSFGTEQLQGSFVKIKDFLSFFLSVIWYTFIIPIISFLYLKELNNLKKIYIKITPKNIKKKIEQYIHEIDDVLGLYIRSQLIVSILDGLIVGIGLSLMGVRYAVLLGVLASLFSIIPNFGFLFTVIITMLITLSGPNPWIMTFKAGIIFVIEEILLTTVITPNVMGTSMGINPLVIMFALMVGATLFGVPGLLLAVPVTAVISRIYTKILEKKIKKQETINEPD